MNAGNVPWIRIHPYPEQYLQEVRRVWANPSAELDWFTQKYGMEYAVLCGYYSKNVVQELARPNRSVRWKLLYNNGMFLVFARENGANREPVSTLKAVTEPLRDESNLICDVLEMGIAPLYSIESARTAMRIGDVHGAIDHLQTARRLSYGAKEPTEILAKLLLEGGIISMPNRSEKLLTSRRTLLSYRTDRWLGLVR